MSKYFFKLRKTLKKCQNRTNKIKFGENMYKYFKSAYWHKLSIFPSCVFSIPKLMQIPFF